MIHTCYILPFTLSNECKDEISYHFFHLISYLIVDHGLFRCNFPEQFANAINYTGVINGHQVITINKYFNSAFLQQVFVCFLIKHQRVCLIPTLLGPPVLYFYLKTCFDYSLYCSVSVFTTYLLVISLRLTEQWEFFGYFWLLLSRHVSGNVIWTSPTRRQKT